MWSSKDKATAFDLQVYTIYCQADTRLHTPTLVIQVSQCASDSQKSKYQRVFIVNFRARYLSLLEKRSQRQYDANVQIKTVRSVWTKRRYWRESYSPLKRVNDADVVLSARCSAAMNSKISVACSGSSCLLRSSQTAELLCRHSSSTNTAAAQRCVLPVRARSLLSRQSLLEGKQADAIHSQREKEPHLRADSNFTPSFWVGGGEVTDWVKVKSQEWEEK